MWDINVGNVHFNLGATQLVINKFMLQKYELVTSYGWVIESLDAYEPEAQIA